MEVGAKAGVEASMEESWQDLSVVQVDKGFQRLVEEIPSWRQFPADG